METTIGELRNLIRETIEGASEEDVQAKLAEFDQQMLPFKDKDFKDFNFEVEFDGMNFKFYFTKGISKSKFYVTMVDDYEIGVFKYPHQAIDAAKKKYERKVRKELKVKVAPEVKAAEAEAKAERIQSRETERFWKNMSTTSAMPDSNGKYNRIK